MKPRDAGGVVDSRLNVYGVEGLKIAGKLFSSPVCGSTDSHPCVDSFPLFVNLDLSICPGNVSAVSTICPHE